MQDLSEQTRVDMIATLPHVSCVGYHVIACDVNDLNPGRLLQVLLNVFSQPLRLTECKPPLLCCTSAASPLHSTRVEEWLSATVQAMQACRTCAEHAANVARMSWLSDMSGK